MVVMNIEGHPFMGPSILGIDSFPNVRAIALICTEAGEGVKIMGVVEGDDIAKAIAESPKQNCWKSHAYHGKVDIYIFETDMSPEERAKFRTRVIEKRAQFMFCDEITHKEEDW
ncbi:MAG: hypothetical protein WCR96_06185 [Candidatus Methanomethylophilaceae archaeon]